MQRISKDTLNYQKFHPTHHPLDPPSIHFLLGLSCWNHHIYQNSSLTYLAELLNK